MLKLYATTKNRQTVYTLPYWSIWVGQYCTGVTVHQSNLVDALLHGGVTVPSWLPESWVAIFYVHVRPGPGKGSWFLTLAIKLHIIRVYPTVSVQCTFHYYLPLIPKKNLNLFSTCDKKYNTVQYIVSRDHLKLIIITGKLKSQGYTSNPYILLPWLKGLITHVVHHEICQPPHKTK